MHWPGHGALVAALLFSEITLLTSFFYVLIFCFYYIFSRLSLSRIPRDSLKYFEISVLDISDLQT